jgi:hypothetical protein
MMFEALTARAAALAERAARRRRSALAQALREAAPTGVRIEEQADGIVLSARGLVRRYAVDSGLKWLIARVR